ncbi:NAD(P)-dependent dehydrogenase (short-subunit alcohol dehydrogenase family) [Paenibacillus phyllosphaerae]|uniref:NAD(P)-dependent dehydrogenase (Short-subunit alcohol dehydrogenase family) n=1 Tax=Paenibacillus phyllosphaerae TaxID=274593 RepID=A0A7W5B1V3_9BACL|nr:SDR family oxidoreductase [Paenibacillus phyllosphaerae]MBB3112878.1 NAD(P)-dependent dehydrogenase (short-subunit alcohol dehydrogenase family) [Paenibacillus phyllosphaerae]
MTTIAAGKWALITGASRGVGAQTAIFMAKQGCNLILHSRNLAHTKALEEEVRACGVQVYSVQAELERLDEVEAMLDEIEARGTQVDILFNNAAVQIAYRTDYFHTPIEDYERSFRINFIAPAVICNRLIPKMLERGFGRVINTTSGIRNEPEQSGYAASKAALDKFTKDLASRLEGTDVTLNLTDPGWCRTDLGGPHAPNAVESVIPGIAVGAFIDDRKSGRFFHAQHFTGMTLEEAIAEAETMEASPYTI